MKYAYVFGSNVYIVPNNSISFTENGETAEFLMIKAIYHDIPNQSSKLLLDLNIKDAEGHEVRIADNKAANAGDFVITEARDQIQILGPDRKEIIEVQQLSDDAAMALEHNIIAELEVNAPVAVIRVRGNFMVGGLHIEIDNEKIFINGESTANSTLAGFNGLVLAASGVVI